LLPFVFFVPFVVKLPLFNREMALLSAHPFPIPRLTRRPPLGIPAALRLPSVLGFAMRPWAAPALFALSAAFAGAGCSLFRSTAGYAPTDKSATPPPQPAAQAPDGDAQIVMQTRLIERPAGDEYLTHGLWKETTDPLPHELSVRLAANGLRVGVVSGPLPVELEKLAASDASVVNPMLRTFRAGRPKAVPVNGPLPNCAAAVRADLSGDPVAKAWPAADCGVIVTATPVPDGRLAVRVEFQIQYGERSFAYQPNSDGTAFDGRHQRTVEPFPTLAFDLHLRRGEVVLFGATAAPAGTLGQAFFYPGESDRLRQRVLLVQPFAAAAPVAPTKTAHQTPAACAAK